MFRENDVLIDFSLLDDSGNEFRLSKQKNKYIIIYFYSKDNTSACTCQAIKYKEYYDEFMKLDTLVVGISKDSYKTHQKFRAKYELPFILLSDEEKEIIEAFDCLKEKNMYGKKVIGTLRSSFIIKDMKILKANYNVKAQDDALENLEFLKELNK